LLKYSNSKRLKTVILFLLNYTRVSIFPFLSNQIAEM